MSPKKSVLTLRQRCVQFLSKLLILVLVKNSSDESINAQIQRYFWHLTNFGVLQDLLEAVLAQENLDAATRLATLQVLLRSDVQKLQIGSFPQTYYDRVLACIASNGHSLQRLNLKGIWVGNDPLNLIRTIESLPNLKVLIIPHTANDTVLDSLVRNCPDLRQLNISGECYYTNKGLSRFHQWQQLKVLDIGSFGKRQVTIDDDDDFNLLATLLERMPQLQSFGTYSFVGSILLALNDIRHLKRHSTPCDFRYLHDTGTNEAIAEAILKHCPHLESLQIDTPEPGALIKLNTLKRLHTVKLTKPRIADVLEFCRTTASPITTLKLNHNYQTRLDLADLAVYIPDLVAIECFQMRLGYSTSPSTTQVYFMKLATVELLYCDVDDAVIQTICTNCPFLRRMIVGCSATLTDEDVFRLCAECAFQNLEEFWLASATALTAVSVELLIQHCPNLKLIGSLSGWDVHQEEVDYLRYVMLMTNTDVILLPKGSIS